MGLMTGQHPHIPYPTPTSMPIDTLVAQPAGAPAVYPLGYDARLLGQASAYPPRLSVADLYGAAAAAYPDPTAASAGYIAGLPPGHPAAMLYPTALTGGYDLKDPRATWAALPQAAGYHCDPALAAYGPYGDRYDPLDSEARRRNATRETTSTLKAWLNEHRKNPYPTKGEKIMLAIITKMTLTQVSTWFANARRRLKKENKMTWEPRNKTADDLDDVSIDEDEGKKDDDEEDRESKTDEEKDSGAEDRPDKGSSSQSDLGVIQSHRTSQQDPKSTSTDHSTETSSSLVSIEKTSDKDRLSSGSPSGPLKDTDSAPSEKPKIWSLAHTATSTSPPSVRRNWPASNFVGSDEFDNHLRMNRLLFHDRLTSRDLCSLPVFHPGRTETATDLRTKLSHDVSESSSLSSPPLWRTSADSLLNAEKFGRLTPLDGNDLRSLSSSSSSGSPAVVSSNFEASSSAPPSLSYSPARYFGSRLVQSHESVRTSGTTDFGARSPVTVFTTDRYPNHSPSILASTVGSIPSPFVRTSPFSCPSSFGHTQASQTTTELRR